MILEEETFREFGYYPKDISYGSQKKILAACDDCGKVRETSKHGYRSLCGSCAHNGKHFTEEHKQKLRVANQNMSKETKQKISEAEKGEKHWNWKGGISCEPYCVLFNEEFRERVREYWGRRCAVCGRTEKEQMNEMKKEGKRAFRLSVHHVNYNKETCCDDSTPLFIPLCASCHSKINQNEEYWENEFKRIIYNRNIDGKCFYSKEEKRKLGEFENGN